MVCLLVARREHLTAFPSVLVHFVELSEFSQLLPCWLCDWIQAHNQTWLSSVFVAQLLSDCDWPCTFYISSITQISRCHQIRLFSIQFNRLGFVRLNRENLFCWWLCPSPTLFLLFLSFSFLRAHFQVFLNLIALQKVQCGENSMDLWKYLLFVTLCLACSAITDAMLGLSNAWKWTEI